MGLNDDGEKAGRGERRGCRSVGWSVIEIGREEDDDAAMAPEGERASEREREPRKRER